MGHLEAAAAAAGLAALVTGPLLAATVAVNAQLRGRGSRANCWLLPSRQKRHAQVERPPIVDRVDETLVIPDASRGGGVHGASR